MNCVIPDQLYIGDLACMLSGDWTESGVGAVISVLSAASPEVDQAMLDHPSVAHMYYMLEDHVNHDPTHEAVVTLFASPPSKSIFQVLDFMQQQVRNKVKIMVHCEQGKQRSAAVACAYLIWWANYTRKEAIQYVQSRRRGAVIPGIWRNELDHLAQLAKIVAESREHHGPDGDCSLTADHYQFLVQLAERTSCYKLLMGRQNTHTIGEDVLVENSPEGSPTSPAFRFERPSVTATIVTESEEARLDFNSDSPECSNVSGHLDKPEPGSAVTRSLSNFSWTWMPGQPGRPASACAYAASLAAAALAAAAAAPAHTPATLPSPVSGENSASDEPPCVGRRAKGPGRLRGFRPAITVQTDADALE
jgi:predicted protein tyrosine phosphatase